MGDGSASEEEILAAEARYQDVLQAYKEDRADDDDIIEAWNDIAIALGELAGAPFPAKDYPLMMERRYSLAQFHGAVNSHFSSIEREEKIRLAAYHLWKDAGSPPGDGTEFWLQAEYDHNHPMEVLKRPGPEEKINSWYSRKHNQYVTIWENKETKKRFIEKQECDWLERLALHWKTTACSYNWSLRGEMKAQEKLKTLITPWQFRSYFFVGSFSEQSKRSNLFYLFRKGKPTVVLRTKSYEPICCLCSHPLGYYQGTWAGALTPTDDVIAHLLMMRADEYNFWKKSNQHPPYSNLAGL